MKKFGGIAGVGSASLVALSLVLTPALATPSQKQKQRSASSSSGGAVGAFTPAVADPRLAAALANRGMQSGSFRFTPPSASSDRSKAIRVAVRARVATPSEAARTLAGPVASSETLTDLAPSSYNLGASVGWKRFAISGDVSEVQGTITQGTRESARVGVSYSPARNVTGRVQVGAERNDGPQRLIAENSNYSLDIGGSYAITRGINVTGGVRYKIQNDRLEPLADDRRDSQAVYIGTAFRF